MNQPSAPFAPRARQTFGSTLKRPAVLAIAALTSAAITTGAKALASANAAFCASATLMYSAQYAICAVGANTRKPAAGINHACRIRCPVVVAETRTASKRVAHAEIESVTRRIGL